MPQEQGPVQVPAMGAWPDDKSKPPARGQVKVRDSQVGQRIQPKKARKAKQKGKSGGKGQVGKSTKWIWESSLGSWSCTDSAFEKLWLQLCGLCSAWWCLGWSCSEEYGHCTASCVLAVLSKMVILSPGKSSRQSRQEGRKQGGLRAEG